MIDLKAIRAATEADMECQREEWEAAISEIQSATVIALLDRLEAAEKDAARYRWLKTGFRAMSLDMAGNHTWVQRSSSMLRGANVDAAVDAAMKEQK